MTTQNSDKLMPSLTNKYVQQSMSSNKFCTETFMCIWCTAIQCAQYTLD